MSLDWHPQEFRRRLDAELHRRAELAGAAGRDEMIKLVSVPGSASSPSRPGQAPRRRTGRLARSIRFLVGRQGDRIFAEVGSLDFRARFLARGTANMAPRPFPQLVLRTARSTFRRILT